MYQPHNPTLYNYLNNLVPRLNEELQESIKNFSELPDMAWFRDPGVCQIKSVSSWENFMVDRGQMRPLARRNEGQFLPRTQIPDVVRDSMTLQLFGEAFPVTREYLKYADRQLELTPQLQVWVNDFGGAAVKRMDDMVSEIYLDAFAGDKFTSREGKPLCANDHAFVHGNSVLDNLSDLPFGEEGLQAGINSGIGTDGNGKGVIVVYDTIITGPELETDVMVLLESLQRPGTPNNDINPMASVRRRWRHVICPHLQDAVVSGASKWWFLTASRHHNVQMHIGQAPVISLERAANGIDLEYQQLMDASAAWYTPRGVFGSTGTAT